VTLKSRLAKLEALRPPECTEIRRIVRRNKYDPPYECTEEDRCPNCGVLGCGVLEIAYTVVVGRNDAGELIDDHGNVVRKQEEDTSD
jgi:hypothetical protein